MAAERVDDGLVAIHGNGCQREDAGVHTHVLKNRDNYNPDWSTNYVLKHYRKLRHGESVSVDRITRT
jgi:hypothetical protein